jgi:hypothetical protein
LPSLVTALITTAVFFTIFDPVDLSILWRPLGPSATGAYLEAFLLFWIFGAASSAMTLLLGGRADPAPRTGEQLARPSSRSRWYVTGRRHG